MHGPNAKLSKTFTGFYDERTLQKEEGKAEEEKIPSEFENKTVLLSGMKQNALRRIHPIFNVRYDKLEKAKLHYYEMRMLSSPSKRKES